MSETACIIGVTSGLGRALAAALTARGLPWTGTRRREAAGHGDRLLDLAAPPETWRLPEATVAFLCAGATALDRCRREPEATARINVEATAALARRLTARGTFVLFYSTNLVLGEDPDRPDETAPRQPVTVYGRQKAAAEERLLALGDRVGVVRLTKVVGPDMPLLAGWRRELTAGREIRPFADMAMAPIAAALVARVSLDLALGGHAGLYHLSAARDVTYAAVAAHLAERWGAPAGLVRPVAAAQSGLDLEYVPRRTVLDADKLRRTLGVVPPGPFEALDGVADHG